MRSFRLAVRLGWHLLAGRWGWDCRGIVSCGVEDRLLGRFNIRARAGTLWGGGGHIGFLSVLWCWFRRRLRTCARMLRSSGLLCSYLTEECTKSMLSSAHETRTYLLGPSSSSSSSSLAFGLTRFALDPSISTGVTSAALFRVSGGLGPRFA